MGRSRSRVWAAALLMATLMVAVSFTGLACATGGAGGSGMSKDDQVRIATDYARQQGIAVEKYKVLSVQSDKGSAHVLFHNENGPPGDHFTVVVDLASRKATRLVPGE